MRQGRCYEAVRQTCETLMLAETVVCMNGVFDEGVKIINYTFFYGGERALQR